MFRSNLHYYAQAIDDENGMTLASASTIEEGGRGIEGNKEQATYVGGTIAQRLEEKGIKEVVFDRSSYPYHGNIKLLADSAREKGLKF